MRHDPVEIGHAARPLRQAVVGLAKILGCLLGRNGIDDGMRRLLDQYRVSRTRVWSSLAYSSTDAAPPWALGI